MREERKFENVKDEEGGRRVLRERWKGEEVKEPERLEGMVTTKAGKG